MRAPGRERRGFRGRWDLTLHSRTILPPRRALPELQPADSSAYRGKKTCSLFSLFDLATAINDKGHFLAVLHCLNRNAFGSGFDIPDLRIAGGFKLGYQFLLGQGIGRRENANDHQTAKEDCSKDCSGRHDPFSLSSGHALDLQRLLARPVPSISYAPAILGRASAGPFAQITSKPPQTLTPRRRLITFKEGLKYLRKIIAYKQGHQTMIDLDSVDAFQGSLPRIAPGSLNPTRGRRPSKLSTEL